MTALPADDDLQQQQALLAAILSRDADPAGLLLREAGTRAAQGLAAYRGNAAAIAARALDAVFPTVAAMVGAEDFAHLAHDFWRAAPPQRGDLGEWGDSFPAWIGAHADFAAWPYLGDAARLDLAVHRCERAEDAERDAASLQWLERAEPSRLRLQLMPGTALIDSRWPLATIHAAHHGGAPDFAAVRDALARGTGEAVLVVRSGWRAAVHRLDAPTARWSQALLAGGDLAQAFDAAGAGFDFAAWLATALRENWLKEVQVLSDQGA